MSDFVVDGRPSETPIGSAAESYAATPPTLERTLNALVGETSTVGAVSRQLQRDALSARPPRQAEPYEMYTPDDEGAPAPTETLPAEDINKLYAPPGTTITDHPMPEGLGKLIGKQKQQEMDRENILARASNARSGLGMFALGTAAFLSDPLNIASVFVPGLGEESTLSGLSRIGLAVKGDLAAQGTAARLAGRGVMGATGAATGQIPITALRYMLGQQEASDYDLRSAMKDLAFAAAGGAILHAGFGAVGDVARTRRTTPGNVAEAPGVTPSGANNLSDTDAWAILNASADSRDAAMRSTVAEIVSGRPVDLGGAFSDMAPAVESLPREPTRLTTFLKKNGGLKNDRGDVNAIFGSRRAARGLLNETEGQSLDDATSSAWQAGYFPDYPAPGPHVLEGAEGRGRPSVEVLLDAIEKDTTQPQYSEFDRDRAENYRQALGRNDEVGEYAGKFGIDPEGLTKSQFWDKVAERLSVEDQSREATSLDNARRSAIAEAEAAAQAFVESRGESWEPDVFYEHGEPRTDADLEREYAAEASAPRPIERAGGAGGSGPAAGGAAAVQEGAGQGGGAARPSGRDRAQGIDTADIAKRQQQLYRTGFASGLTGDELEKAEAELLGEKEADQDSGSRSVSEPKAKSTQRDVKKGADPELAALEDAAATRQTPLTAEERADFERTAAAVDHAERLESAAKQAAQCLIEAGA